MTRGGISSAFFIREFYKNINGRTFEEIFAKIPKENTKSVSEDISGKIQKESIEKLLEYFFFVLIKEIFNPRLDHL